MEKEVRNYFEGKKERALKTLEELTQIPAPSFEENERALYCIRWLGDIGIENAFTDECGNVILSFAHEEDRHNKMFMAHLDTVFPAGTELDIMKDGSIWRCPGIGDDTSNAVCMLMLVEYMWDNARDMLRNCIFVWDVCEEGLGNLRGSKNAVEKYRNCIDCFVGFDLYSDSVYDSSIGSVRYEIKVSTEGGHSYLDFGRKNAIAKAARIIDELYGYVPCNDETVHTTYNVGVIEGGTSVNTIASGCTFLWEYRSNDRCGLKRADEFLREAIARSGENVDVRVIGERPCMGNPDREVMKALSIICSDAIKSVTGKAPVFGAASTDCNIPLSLDIPAVCAGLIRGGNAHRNDEWADTDSITEGCIIAYLIFEKIMKEL